MEVRHYTEAWYWGLGHINSYELIEGEKVQYHLLLKKVYRASLLWVYTQS